MEEVEEQGQRALRQNGGMEPAESSGKEKSEITSTSSQFPPGLCCTSVCGTIE